MVHRAPTVLARILSGDAPCRWGPRAPHDVIEPDTVHSVVLWTKDPTHLLTHAPLRAALLALKKRHGVEIALQVTATGFGGSFIEPNIPAWQRVVEVLETLFDEGWIDPRAVVYRYDPFLSIRTPGGFLLSNASLPLFERLATAFVGLGIPRVITSRGDAQGYPRVLKRLAPLGLEWVSISDERAQSLCRSMDKVCVRLGAGFSVCCDPVMGELESSWSGVEVSDKGRTSPGNALRGCVDGRLLNQLKKGRGAPATERLHNEIGKQRAQCACTYSRDIGYSTGSATCFSGGFGCLYCYAQGNARVPNPAGLTKDIMEYDGEPEAYLMNRGLPVELWVRPDNGH